tara:strand:+ start:4067 stop:4213 length:147 start_codon:yes stop_codon:yes gene_type:complete
MRVYEVTYKKATGAIGSTTIWAKNAYEAVDRIAAMPNVSVVTKAVSNG